MFDDAPSFSRENGFFVCYQFFKQLRNRLGGKKPICTDDAPVWYDTACRWLRLKHHVFGTELKKNLLMERFIQYLKDRTDEFFDDHFPCRKEGCDRQHVWNWLKNLFVLYLHTGMDRIQFTALVRNGG
jgi:transposase-like protein